MPVRADGIHRHVGRQFAKELAVHRQRKIRSAHVLEGDQPNPPIALGKHRTTDRNGFPPTRHRQNDRRGQQADKNPQKRDVPARRVHWASAIAPFFCAVSDSIGID